MQDYQEIIGIGRRTVLHEADAIRKIADYIGEDIDYLLGRKE